MKKIIGASTKTEVYTNARTCAYPDGSSLVMLSDRPIFRRPGFEQTAASPNAVSNVEMLRVMAELADPELEMRRLEREGKQMELARPSQENESLRRSIRRAKSRLRDLVRSNAWDYFVTLTLDPSKVPDRRDIVDITRRLNQWADNQVRRHGLAYVLVPELHKDGAVHFHGFFRGGVSGVDSGTLTFPGRRPRKPRSKAEREKLLSDGWQVVYNLPAWSLGFTTAIRPYGDVDAAAAYVLKYITKEARTTGKIGGRWYYSGGDLAHPDIIYGEGDVDAAAEIPGAYEGTIPGLGCRLVMVRFDKDGCPVFRTPKEEKRHGNDGLEEKQMGGGSGVDD